LTHKQLAGAKRAFGQIEEAARHEQLADQATPNDPLYHRMLGLRLANMGMQEIADKHFARAVQLEPHTRPRRPN
jgi:Flp pilus assembly protein TadD